MVSWELPETFEDICTQMSHLQDLILRLRYTNKQRHEKIIFVRLGLNKLNFPTLYTSCFFLSEVSWLFGQLAASYLADLGSNHAIANWFLPVEHRS